MVHKSQIVLVAISLCIGTCRYLSDWDQYALVRMECAAKIAVLSPCDQDTPVSRQECLNAILAAQLEYPCADATEAFGKLLEAGDKKVAAMFRSECPDEESIEQGSDSPLIELCREDSPKGYATAMKKYLEDKRREGEKQLAAFTAFIQRDPGGFRDAKWGSTRAEVAKEIVSNLKPKQGISGWDDVRNAARGSGGSLEVLMFTASDNTQWYFGFDKDRQFNSYAQIPSSLPLAHLLITCREMFGPPTESQHDAEGESLSWKGPQSTVRCENGWGSPKKPWVFVVAAPRPKPSTKRNALMGKNAPSTVKDPARIHGRFVSVGDSLVSAITFDSKAMAATLESSLFSFTSGKMSFPYRASSAALYISDPARGDIPFTIKDQDTLVCEMKIIGDVYKRK